MEEIVFFDDDSQTEHTLLLNAEGYVVGVEIYFGHPRQVSDFWNKNSMYKRIPTNVPKINKQQVQSRFFDPANPNPNPIPIPPEMGQAPYANHPDVRTSITKRKPCNQ